MQNKVSDGLFYNEVYLIAFDSMELATLISLLIMACPLHHLTLLLANKKPHGCLPCGFAFYLKVSDGLTSCRPYHPCRPYQA